MLRRCYTSTQWSVQRFPLSRVVSHLGAPGHGESCESDASGQPQFHGNGEFDSTAAAPFPDHPLSAVLPPCAARLTGPLSMPSTTIKPGNEAPD